ncbi:PREDICTED: sterol O-acyltransferase 1-like isoform X1 [Trachymyrmex cornetzi]|uniref:O-acyltransferase n=1 Tax=Trachymyrmex cornetzi TaxID=471704 RepID=A0A151J746_9HYME|nr:PREDICTED: sterol O-acyltransferase 1-like isoform X1 [Trachymyrmex cornetzi]KYN19382.1 Sterol O-acyltransferase 1 [Trachymyrmex cornetzi]
MSSVIETINAKDIANSLHEKDKDVANRNAFMDVLHETTADVLRKRIQEIREDVLGHVNKRFNDMMSEVLQKLEAPLVKNGELLYSTDKYRDKRESSKKGALPDKEFLERNSLLTDLFEIPHIRTVYNLFMVTLILLFFNTVVSDIMESGTFHVGTNTLWIGFAKFSTCIYIWSFMQVSTLSVYVAFTLWANQRLRFLPKSSILKLWDYTWLSIFISYLILFIIFPIKAMLNANLSIGCSLIVIMEQIRMMMKTYAFVRSAAPRFLSYKPHSEISRPSGPTFSQYLYFLFAPTLVYRDEYPRTKRIRWMVVIRNFAEVGLAIFYLAFILERLVLPVYHVYETQHLERKWFVKNIIECSIPGILYFITGQYLLLHAWLNAWAEILQFADRLFYKDWWNSTTYHTYYRKWNVVVHDWLYTYIYKDMYEILVPRNRMLSATSVFLVSAIVHEYILAFGFGFFYPVMFMLFGVAGFAMFYVRKVVTSNVFMWLTWSVGNGIMFSLYAMEFYARHNCPPLSNYYLDLFIPRSWRCQKQFNA